MSFLVWQIENKAKVNQRSGMLSRLQLLFPLFVL